MNEQPQDVEGVMQRAGVVKKAYQEILMSKANVVGVGVGLARRGNVATSQIGLVVLVTRKLPLTMLAEQDIIPREIEGVPVDVQEVGAIAAQNE